jgi:hypothetical protein
MLLSSKRLNKYLLGIFSKESTIMKKTNFGDVPIGLLLIAAFYIFGAFMMLVSIFINPIGVSQTIAVVHGLSPSMGVEILLAVAALALVLAGRHDFLFPPEHQAILADRLANAELVLIERAGHNPQMERPAEVIEAIRRFMVTANPGCAFPGADG